MSTSEPDATISRTVEAICTYRRIPKSRVYRAMGVSRTAFYERTHGGTRWSAADVLHAAEALDVDVALLYRGIDSIPTTGSVTPRFPDIRHLRVVRGGSGRAFEGSDAPSKITARAVHLAG